MAETTAERPIAIAGAGSIGCYVGGCLATSGKRVAFLARQRVADDLARNGLRVTSFAGLDRTVPPGGISVSTDPAMLADAGIILVTVKSRDTPEMAQLLARHAAPDATIVSLQNGVGNVAVLREHLPGRNVVGGMVPFNVIGMGEGRYHRATSGDIVLAGDAAGTAGALSTADLPFHASDEIENVMWGKLLLNLNNALNALSDLPLRAQLAQRPWRRLLADQMAEALRAYRAAGIRPVAASPVPPWVTPWLLRLPDPLFKRVLGKMMDIDPKARTSMWQDLNQRRPTEIDYLQGAVLALATKHGVAVPLTQRIIDCVRQAEASNGGPPGLSPEAVRGAEG